MVEGLGPGPGQIKSGPVPEGSGPSAPISQSRTAPSKKWYTSSIFRLTQPTLIILAEEKVLVKQAKVPLLGSARHPPMSMTCSTDE